jgi:adenosine/AMP kinase
VEDLYEAMIASTLIVLFGLVFCEASGARAIIGVIDEQSPLGIDDKE